LTQIISGKSIIDYPYLSSSTMEDVLKNSEPVNLIFPGAVNRPIPCKIRSASELDEISRLLSHPKVGELSRKIDEVNPKRETTTGKGGPDIFEI